MHQLPATCRETVPGTVLFTGKLILASEAWVHGSVRYTGWKRHGWGTGSWRRWLGWRNWSQ